MSEDLRLSVIVPVYDEEKTVDRLVRRVRAVGPDWEILCVDDASTDGTRAVLEALERDSVIERLLTHEHNRGKGAAIRTAIPHATGDVVAVQDAAAGSGAASTACSPTGTGSATACSRSSATC